jgi:hypothetical protein
MKVDIGTYNVDTDKQDVSVIIEKHDTWNLDVTLAHIIYPALVELKKTKHGAPFVDYEDVPEELRPGSEWIDKYNYDGETDPDFFNRWEWIMDEMIWAFDIARRGEYILHTTETENARMMKAFVFFGKYYTNLWD